MFVTCKCSIRYRVHIDSFRQRLYLIHLTFFLLLGQKSELFEDDDLGPGIEVIEEDQAVLDEIERADASPVPLD